MTRTTQTQSPRSAHPVALLLTVMLLLPAIATAASHQSNGVWVDKFRQLQDEWPTPNSYRNAAGQPGHEYWQQEADYKIQVRLD